LKEWLQKSAREGAREAMLSLIVLEEQGCTCLEETFIERTTLETSSGVTGEKEGKRVVGGGGSHQEVSRRW
jgi:hypothetical protein